MNMKQKLTYMLIGCLFTLAGTVISNLTNIPTQAQDDNVIDEIVCKKLKIVNEDGYTVAELDSIGRGGSLKIYNKVGLLEAVLHNSVFGGTLELHDAFAENVMLLNKYGLKIKNDQGKTTVELGNNVLSDGGFLKIFDKKGRLEVELESDRIGGGELTIYRGIKEPDVGPSVYLNCIGMYIDNDDGKTVTELGIDGLRIYNEDGMKYEKDGESIVLKNKLVTIGAEKGRSNDGLINIYNHKGDWRSYRAD